MTRLRAGVVSLTRRVTFTATHRYHRNDWDASRNDATFGKGQREHGHEYTCDVTLRGRVDRETGMLVDLPALDRVLHEEIVSRFNGRALHELPEFGGKRQPTGEELALFVAERVGAALKSATRGVRVAEVRVAENELLWATWRRR